MKKFRIKGKVVHQDLEGGFWGVVGEDGRQWLPVNMPEQLKEEGKEVSLTVKETETVSIQMWGTPIQVLSFHT